jgi:hypothetical protein
VKKATTRFKFVILTFLVCGILSVLGSQAVSAVPSPFIPEPGPALPEALRNYFRACYGPLTPAVANWVSKKGSGGTTTLTVPYGTTYADLDLNLAGIVCRGDSQVSETRSYAIASSLNVPGTITGLNGATNRIDYKGSPGGYTTPRTYRQAGKAFRFTPTRPFTESKTYRISVVTENVNKFPNNSPASRYACVAPKGYPIVNINNFDEHSRCYNVNMQFDIRINVSPHRPIGAAVATCDLPNGRIKIEGGVTDPNLPGQWIYTSFRIVGDENPLVNGPVKRGALFSFYVKDARLLDGDQHYMRMLVYDDNKPPYVYSKDPTNHNNDFGNISVKCPKAAKNYSACATFAGGSNIPAANPAIDKDISIANLDGSPRNDKNVNPGEELLMGVSMYNNGSNVWKLFTHALDLSPDVPGAVLAKSPYPSGNKWSVDNSNRRVYWESDQDTVPIKNTVNFWFKVKIPTNAENNITFNYRMNMHTPDLSGAPVGRFGGTCSITLDVPVNRPFLSVGGGDVFSGASFGSVDDDMSCNATAAALNANIRTNGYYSEVGTGNDALRRINGSSHSQYGTFASGMIGDDSDYGNNNTFLGNYGYDRSPQKNVKDALFANDANGGDYGSFYDGGTQTMPCVDISTEQRKSEPPTALSAAQASAFIASGEGVKTSTNDITLNATDIVANGNDKTLIVNGAVTINGSIRYSGTNGDASKLSHLKIIAQNIYIPYSIPTADQATTPQRIDADLVAMPTVAGGTQSNGIIDTCSGYKSTAGQWFSGGANAPIASSCGYTENDGLVFGGSVAARRILWKRTHGTLGIRKNVARESCYYGSYEAGDNAPILNSANTNYADYVVVRYKRCAAELIDTNPQSLINALNNANINQNIPTSTTELPPVY